MRCSARTAVLAALTLENLHSAERLLQETDMAEDEAAEEIFSEESAAPKWQVFVNDLSWSEKQIRPTKRMRDLPS